MTPDPRARFLRLLKNDILKLDLAELDFGVYRVLAHRRQEIERFFDETLPQRIKEALASGGADRAKQLDERLTSLKDQLTQTAQALGMERAFDAEGALADALRQTPKGEEYRKLADEGERAAAGAGFEDTEEAQIFAHLYTFFSRYYRDGDFLPQPRRGRKAQFSVPYQGEDVHFSWRGRGNHYVKTAEELSRYDFRFPVGSPAARVRFELTRADEEENNVKGKTRYFLPLSGEARTEEAGEDGLPVFIVPFEFRPLDEAETKRFTTIKKDEEEDASTLQQAALDEAFPKLLESAPDVLKREGGAEALEKHLGRYARKNRTDYFVHPDLGSFLRAELDFFLKNEVLDVAALTDSDGTAQTLVDRLAKLRVVKSIAGDVITLLAQVEDVQARLFEKRKLVLKADYLAPVVALPVALHAEIIANAKQRQAWADLFDVKLGEGDVEELKRRPTLVVNTAHFDQEFKERLLASVEDLEEALGGVLIHGENYGALRTLGPVYEGRVKCVYLDPPYNTGNDDFLYKDDFSRHSTWLTMMEERLRLGRDFLSASGSHYAQIDANENARLLLLLNHYLEYQREIIWDIQVLSGFKVMAPNWIRGHETIYYHSKSGSPYFVKLTQPHKEEYLAMFDRQDDEGRWYMVAHGKKRYRDEVESKGKFFGDVWSDVMSFQQQPTAAERIAFDTQKPEKLIDRIIRSATRQRDYVLDYFGGSGTTAATALKTHRRFIVVEMGSHFEDVLLPRMQRALWGEETAVSRESGYKGGGAIIQVLKLESYEGSLNALETPAERSARLRGQEDIFGDDYLLRYFLPLETGDSTPLLNLKKLEDPFTYRLRVHTPDGVSEQPVDLVETFPLVMGLRPVRRWTAAHEGAMPDDEDRMYTLMEARARDGSLVLVVWRPVAGLDAKSEKDWLTEQLEAKGRLWEDYAKVWMNATGALPKGEELDAAFRRALLARDPHVVRPLGSGNGAAEGEVAQLIA